MKLYQVNWLLNQALLNKTGTDPGLAAIDYEVTDRDNDGQSCGFNERLMDKLIERFVD